MVFTPYQFAELVRVFGADHVVMGTDYPFDMLEYDPVGHIAGSKVSTPLPSRRWPAATANGFSGCDAGAGTAPRRHRAGNRL